MTASDKLLPFSGYLVIEAGGVIAASFCGQLLADFGATVVKIEPPKSRGIDTLRHWGRVYKDGEGFLSCILNRNKKLITLDISSLDGAPLFARLLERADVLIENFKPGTMAGWGFDEERLKTINDRLIHVAISGFGQTGPMAKRTAFGAIAEAMGGLRALTGYTDRPPVRAGVSIGDSLAGLYAAFGTAMALLERKVSNRGQTVDVAIYEAVLGVIEDLLPTLEFFDTVRGPVGTGFDRFAPSNIYPTQNGGWILIAAPTDKLFRKLANCMNQRDLPDNPLFASQAVRAEHRGEIDGIIAEWTSTRDVDEIVQLLERENIPSGKVYTGVDILADPHIQAREMVVSVPNDRVGTVPMQGVVPKLSRTDGRILTSGGRIGCDNDEVYRKLLSLTADQVTALCEKGVI